MTAHCSVFMYVKYDWNYDSPCSGFRYRLFGHSSGTPSHVPEHVRAHVRAQFGHSSGTVRAHVRAHDRAHVRAHLTHPHTQVLNYKVITMIHDCTICNRQHICYIPGHFVPRIVHQAPSQQPQLIHARLDDEQPPKT